MSINFFLSGAQSPPGCFNSEYGCCWDYATPAIGPGGRGCPPCEDNPRYPNVCQRFKTYCLRKGISGRWMRVNCPSSCGHCGTYIVIYGYSVVGELNKYWNDNSHVWVKPRWRKLTFHNYKCRNHFPMLSSFSKILH